MMVSNNITKANNKLNINSLNSFSMNLKVSFKY